VLSSKISSRHNIYNLYVFYVKPREIYILSNKYYLFELFKSLCFDLNNFIFTNQTSGSAGCTDLGSNKQSMLVKIKRLMSMGSPASHKVAVPAAVPKTQMSRSAVVASSLIGTPLDATCISINYDCYIWLGLGGHRVRRDWVMRLGILQQNTRPGGDCKSLGSRISDALRPNPCSWPNLFKSVEFHAGKRIGVVSLRIAVSIAMCKYVLIAALAVMVSGQLKQPPITQ